jgi:hypothetical protein
MPSPEGGYARILRHFFLSFLFFILNILCGERLDSPQHQENHFNKSVVSMRPVISVQMFVYPFFPTQHSRGKNFKLVRAAQLS